MKPGQHNMNTLIAQTSKELRKSTLRPHAIHNILKKFYVKAFRRGALVALKAR